MAESEAEGSVLEEGSLSAESEWNRLEPGPLAAPQEAELVLSSSGLLAAPQEAALMLSSSETDLVTSDDDFSDASGTSNLVSADDEPRRTGAPATPDDSIMEWTSSSEGILHDDPGNTSASMPTVLGQPWIGKVCSRLVSENTHRD